MSKFLYQIGQFSYRRPWVAIIAWLLLLAAVIVPVAVNGVSMSSNMSINGTKSQEVLDRLAGSRASPGSRRPGEHRIHGEGR